MLIQPPVQSATQVATFVNSMSATGVEQPVVRTSIMPVEESKSDASTQNSLQRFQGPGAPAAKGSAVPEKSAAADKEAESPDDAEQAAATQKAASAQELRQQEADRVVIDQLKARDREVRVHEAAHASAGGQYAGSPSLQYTRGPDGKNYATGGEVSISTSPVSGDPNATIVKARVIRAAALAPAEPSAQDRRVASEAAQMEVRAQVDLQALEAKEQVVAEKAREEKLEEAKARKLKQEDAAAALAEEDDAATETAKPEKPEPVAVVQVAAPVATNKEEEKDDASEKDDAAAKEEPRPNARQQLEKILLGSRGLLVDANGLGLVDPHHPYGQSGYLNVLA